LAESSICDGARPAKQLRTYGKQTTRLWHLNFLKEMIRITKAGQFVAFGGNSILLLPLLFPGSVIAASLGPATSKAWDDYVESANRRMEQRLTPGRPFLWVDEAPDRLARVRAGEVLVSPGSKKSPRRIPSGLIHDWIGAIFIPDVTLADVMQVVSDYAGYKDFYNPTVAESKPIASGEETDRFSMLLMNKSLLLKTAFDTDYESCYVRVDAQRGYSTSWTTRVQEVAEHGTPRQHLLRVGEGSGFIWRLFSIARYVERDGGVYVELDAIGLSRDIPASLRWFVEPIVRRVSRSALSTTLQQTESAVHASALRKAATGGVIGVAERESTTSGDLKPVHRSH
jgi:hypothetical protein